jgi:hypothetical protein
MLTDGLKDQEFDEVQQLDVAEILLRAVRGEDNKPTDAVAVAEDRAEGSGSR